MYFEFHLTRGRWSGRGRFVSVMDSLQQAGMQAAQTHRTTLLNPCSWLDAALPSCTIERNKLRNPNDMHLIK